MDQHADATLRPQADASPNRNQKAGSRAAGSAVVDAKLCKTMMVSLRKDTAPGVVYLSELEKVRDSFLRRATQCFQLRVSFCIHVSMKFPLRPDWSLYSTTTTTTTVICTSFRES